MNHDISIQVYSIPLALPIHQEIYWMYILSESVEGYRTANEPSPTTCEADHHDLSGCHRRWGPTSRTSSGSWHRLCLDRTRRNRLTIFAVRLGPEISLPSLPGPLMGVVLTGSQRGCSDSANRCARRLQHVFRQPKAASSTMQCYRRVWRLMSCYIFQFVYVCLMWCHFSLGWHLGTSFVCWGTALADGKDRANSFLAQAELQKYTLGSLGMLVEVLMES